ncbi:MAG: type II toxin-antitoxin system PemK/MazF family toxin [Anaerocolumna sp.]
MKNKRIQLTTPSQPGAENFNRVNRQCRKCNPMTQSFRQIDRPEHIFIDKNDCENLRESGMAMCEQLCSADRTQVIKKIAAITDRRLIEKLNIALIYQLELLDVRSE